MSVKISKGPTDPLCTRISVGGNPKIGFYCVYRGALDASICALRESLEAMERLKTTGKEPAVNRQFKELGAS